MNEFYSGDPGDEHVELAPCGVEKDNGRVISNKEEDYCQLPKDHQGKHSWERDD